MPVHNLPRQYTSNIDRFKKIKKSFTLEKARSRRFPALTIAGSYYTDDITLLANTPAQTESLLYSQAKAAGGIGPHFNSNKTEYMCLYQN